VDVTQVAYVGRCGGDTQGSVRPRIVVAAWFMGAPVARMLIASRLGVP